jgi:hypothetical protein
MPHLRGRLRVRLGDDAPHPPLSLISRAWSRCWRAAQPLAPAQPKISWKHTPTRDFKQLGFLVFMPAAGQSDSFTAGVGCFRLPFASLKVRYRLQAELLTQTLYESVQAASQGESPTFD